MIQTIKTGQAKQMTEQAENQLNTDHIFARWTVGEDGTAVVYLVFNGVATKGDNDPNAGIRLTGSHAEDVRAFLQTNAYNPDKSEEDDSPRDILDVVATQNTNKSEVRHIFA